VRGNIIMSTLGLPRGLYVANIDKREVAYLDKLLLDSSGRLQLLSSRFYKEIPPIHISVWGNLNGRYCFPTIELVGWIKQRINGRTAIEVGAGCGDLGYHLGIPMTDSYQQQDDRVTKDYFASLGLVPTTPHSDVKKKDAELAVLEYKPEVVIASWLTQKYLPGDMSGNMLGPMEESIIDNCKEYIFIGNKVVHGNKRILSRFHEEFVFPWYISRSIKPDENVIWVWRNK